MTERHAAPPTPLVETAAGFSAGIVSTAAVHPLDIIKTRLQLNPSSSSSSNLGASLRITRDIVRNEGSLRGLYRGFTPNALGSSVSWGLYFLFYSSLKTTLATHHARRDDGIGSRSLSSGEYFLASAAAGLATAAATNPIWVLKTRMLASGRAAPGAYRGVAHGARLILATEGIKGFYRGLTPSLLGVSHGAVQFALYERLRNWRSRSHAVPRSDSAHHIDSHTRKDLSNTDTLLISAVAKVAAGTLTYPFQLVRARLQTYDADATYRSTGDAVRRTWTREGLGGFYKG
ncbi:MAG: hypothetical protein M1832_005745 [Thelocarpon impressellum]|nr:MAG: hypothetical protein M1832_005745 [Thelocarpon impressellum]